MSARPLLVALAIPLVLLTLGGCRSYTLEPPADFLTLDARSSSGYAMRATSASGVVFSLREVQNERGGTLAFWRDAIRERLRTDRGYALIEERELTARSGEPGVQLRFGRDEGNQPYTYWVSLYAADRRLFVVEAGGKEEAFAAIEEQLEAAIRGFTVH